jgi:hypothetical protein
VNGVEVQAWLERNVIAHEEADAEVLHWKSYDRDVRIVEPKRDTGIDSEFDRAVAAAALRLRRWRRCNERENAENYDSFYHWSN